MLSSKTKAKAGAKGTWMLVKHPTLRRATVKAAKPTAKLGVKRKSRQLKTQQTAKQRVLPALAIGIGIGIIVIVLIELNWARRRKGSDDPAGEPQTPAGGEQQTPGPAPAAGTPQ